MKMTDHLDSDEFACHDGQAYPTEATEDGTGIPTGWTPPADQPRTWQWCRLLPLCLTIEAVRARVQKEYNLTDAEAQMIVDSGFRDEEYDDRLYEQHVAAVGDDGLVAPASRSIHPKGGAADMKHKAVSPVQIFTLALHMYVAGELPYLGGIGLYPSFVHFDVRPRGAGGQHLAIWGGRRPSNIA